MCDIVELKKVMKMSFGDWEMFRMMILMLRDQEFHMADCADVDNLTQERGYCQIKNVILCVHVMKEFSE